MWFFWPNSFNFQKVTEVRPGHFVNQAEAIFSRGGQRDEQQQHDAKDMQAKIGQLTLENDFLKQVLGR